MTGTIGAGKTEVSEIFKEKGFKHFSVRDFLTEKLDRKGREHSRDNMVYIANELREKNSPSYLAEKLYEKARNYGGNCVIESLRTEGEINILKEKDDFILIAVDANLQTRYERVVIRKHKSDEISFDKFMEDERREMTSTDPNKQNLKTCIEIADIKITNNGSIEELRKDVEELLDRIGFKEEKQVLGKQDNEYKKDGRPSWDEYFMEISKTVAKRATCDRGKSGCVIVKNKQILVTGYVGSPVGLPHCDEVGHQMKTTTHEDGTQTQHCVRTTHAEQNAICQAAKLGVPIEGSTLYCKMTPCAVCAKLIINSGIKRVVCESRYHAGAESEMLFSNAGVLLETLNDEILKYENQ